MLARKLLTAFGNALQNDFISFTTNFCLQFCTQQLHNKVGMIQDVNHTYQQSAMQMNQALSASISVSRY